MRNFTVVDTLGTLKACAALLPFMFAQGTSRDGRLTFSSSGSVVQFCA